MKEGWCSRSMDVVAGEYNALIVVPPEEGDASIL